LICIGLTRTYTSALVQRLLHQSVWALAAAVAAHRRRAHDSTGPPSSLRDLLL
jgi:hypothetical protein